MTSNLNESLNTMTGAAQTMTTWARVIDSYADVPDIYKTSCQAVLEEREPFPYVVLVPSVKDNRLNEVENLLCEINGIFYVWERIGNKVVSSAFPLREIYTLEAGIVLLSSWFTISGLTTTGSATTARIGFNSSSVRHLLPVINKMRPAPADIDDAAWQVELAAFDYLASANFKFMNYARESMVRGEKILQSILQPKIRRQVFDLFGYKFHRTVGLAHLTILTDKEIIFIRDDEDTTEVRGERYGGVWQYIPLQKIQDVKLTASGNKLLTLTLTLESGIQQLDKVFESSSQDALEELQKKLKQMVGEA